MTEKISIIVPIYNVDKYLKRCLNSIINQTYRYIEILLIDDGSTDLSGKICDEYKKKDKRIKVIHCKNRGVSEARNKGLEIATGEWIGFVDPDDWIDRDMYESLYRMVKLYNVDISVCSYKRCKDFSYENIVSKKNDECKLLDNKLSMKNMLVNDLYCGAVWNKLYKRDILMNNKFKKNMIIGEDVLFNFNLLYNTKINTVYNKIPKYNYFYRDNSVINSKKIDRKILSQLKVRQYIYNLIKNNEYNFFIKEYNYKYFKLLIGLLLKVCKENNLEHKYLYNELKKNNKNFLKISNALTKKDYIYILFFSLPYIISNKIMFLWNLLKGCNK
ncbi:glycosyltransferase [Megamonas rupellensis]|uniref:Glycosyltransferase n=1 Tax=Megamonas rupellensis TaxID=491921 RepID=A0A411ZMG6_9FIRM|nr:glycosyltransferase [Megamonas rupellensis]RGQ04009.1 glycosyltransferase [Megamonas rupellensis]